MTRNEQLLELARRCEAAAGPDRELDDLIIQARCDWSGDVIVMDYTASLDAAMTLVPEGMHWEIGRTPYLISEGKARAFVGRSVSVSATAALALCAAALKARAGGVS